MVRVSMCEALSLPWPAELPSAEPDVLPSLPLVRAPFAVPVLSVPFAVEPSPQPLQLVSEAPITDNTRPRATTVDFRETEGM